MSETRSAAGGLGAALLAFGLLAGALGGGPLRSGANAAPGGAGEASAQGSRADGDASPPAGKYDRMGARLLALSLGDTASAPAASAYGPAQLGVMVATLPDPVDSHEDWVYDATLEALRRAHERAGYVIDRMWLPWASRGDSAARDAAPGVLLFRAAGTRAPDAKHPQYRLVYLVGEVSTAGVHPRALLTALAERDRLLGARVPNTLQVVGPTFSASAAGLGRLLAAWRAKERGRTVQVITGSATNRDNRAAFPHDPGFVFGSTVNSNETLFSTLENVILPSLAIDTAELAILTEGSAYARTLGEKGGGYDKLLGVRRKQPLRLTFPMNIGSLRAESPAAGRAPADRAEQPRVALTLSDAARPMESPPPASRLTVAAIDLTVDQIAQTLRTHNVRAIVVAATDIRDRIFLMSELRQRLRDVHFFALEANTLYLAPEHLEALRGMVVVSTYSLLPETQTWSGGSAVVPFTGEYAQGVYNATLWQIGDGGLLDYQFPAAGEPRRPPVWITALGSTGMIPLRVLRSGDEYASVARSTPDGAVAEPDPTADFLSVASYLALLAVAGLVAGRSARRLRRHARDAAAERAALAAREEAGGAWLAALAPADAARVNLFRRARWASLRYQQQLYRFLGAVAVAGATLPAGVVFAAAVLRARHAGSPGWAVKITAAAAELAVLAAVLAVVLTGVELWRWWAGERAVFRERRGAAPRGRLDLWRVNEGARRAVLTLGLLYLGLSLAFALECWYRARESPVSFTLLFYRAIRLDSGLSPLAPLLICAAGFLAWTAWHQRRVGSLRQMTTFEAAALTKDPAIALADVDAGEGAGEPDGAADDVLAMIPRRAVHGVRQVRERLFRLVPDWRGVALAAVLTVVCAYVWLGADPTLELLSGTVWFGNLYLFGVAGIVAATAWGVYRLLGVWSALRRVLQSLAGTPLVTAFERLPTRVSRLARLGFVGVPHSAVIGPISALQWRHLMAATRALKLDAAAAPAPAAGAKPAVQVPHLVGEAGTLAASHPVADAAAVAVADAPAADPAGAPAADEAGVRRAVAAYMAGRCAPGSGFGSCGDEGPHGDHLLGLAGVLEAFWEAEPDAGELGHVSAGLARAVGGGGPSFSGQVRRSFGEPLRAWLVAAEEYAAVQVVDYAEWVVAQLRVLAFFLFVALVLTTALLSSYPYERQSVVKLVFFVILLASVGGLLRVSVEMNRDEVLSRVAKTEPGKITWDRHFITNGLVFGLVPIATLVSSEFPAVREFLFAWIYPLTRLLGGGG